VITITDNFETAQLEASVTIDGTETTSLTVTNVYKAAETDATLEVYKEIEDKSGSAYETEFTFTLADEEGKTIVLVTHTREIAQMATRIITMKDGRVIKEEKNDHIVKAEEVQW
jgi:hypothetical protein